MYWADFSDEDRQELLELLRDAKDYLGFRAFQHESLGTPRRLRWCADVSVPWPRQKNFEQIMEDGLAGTWSEHVVEGGLLRVFNSPSAKLQGTYRPLGPLELLLYLVEEADTETANSEGSSPQE